MQDQLHLFLHLPDTVTIGAVPNPIPASVTTYLTIPFDVVLIEQVASTAPVPPPPVMVMVGVSVYPNPAFVITFIDDTFALEVVNATAVASELSEPLGDVLIETVGVPVNPEPSLFKNISRINPVATTGDACAVIPTPTNWSPQHTLHHLPDYLLQRYQYQ